MSRPLAAAVAVLAGPAATGIAYAVRPEPERAEMSAGPEGAASKAAVAVDGMN
jgi:hypothetical protein